MNQHVGSQIPGSENLRPSEPESPITVARIKDAYGSPGFDAEGMLGTRVSPNDPDRAVIEPWAKTVAGSILDVGSGTGRWTGHLAVDVLLLRAAPGGV